MLPVFYRYMAIFTFEKDGIHITFPDLPGCVSFGKDETEAMEKAREALAFHLYGMEQDHDSIPIASSILTLQKEEPLEDNEVFCLIEAFMPAFREKQNKRFVKKTLSIPYWLNAQAEACEVNFSQTLQSALKKELNLVP